MKITDKRMLEWGINEQPQSKLLSLPGDIRRQIYQHTLTVAPDFKGRVAISHKLEYKTESVLALIQTCRMVHKEAAAIFYTENELELHENSHATAVVDFNSLVKTLSSSRLDNIRTLIIDVNGMALGFFLMSDIEDTRNFHSLEKVIIKPNTTMWNTEEALMRFKSNVAALKSAVKGLKCIKELGFEFGGEMTVEQESLSGGR